ncbi:MAG: bifunctional glutamate N-acetyltransferase/amino-acid acetyltransferase ArgJ [Thermodesulfobacteriota bacterium]
MTITRHSEHPVNQRGKMDLQLPKGFKAAGIISGIKKNGKKDLGLIFSQIPANAAGVFTTNSFQAAPVILDKDRIRSGRCQAILANSGCANSCTGEKGLQHAKKTASWIASELQIPDKLVLVASTGVIGEPLPIGKIEDAVPSLIQSLSFEGALDFAEAIMTTDTVPKAAFRQIRVEGTVCTIAGIAKGAGMIHPDMATLLCFVCTDANINTVLLSEMLSESVGNSLNRITIDGDTSTNDTVLIMANAASGVTVETPERVEVFQAALNEVMLELARKLVKDAEGATKLVEILVDGAESKESAEKVANTVAGSILVKTALFGEDANWGRIMAAAGRSGIAMDPGKMDIYFDKVRMVQNGCGCGKGAEAEASLVLKKPEFRITLHLGSGKYSASVLTCDLSVDYIKINADYRS